MAQTKNPVAPQAVAVVGEAGQSVKAGLIASLRDVDEVFVFVLRKLELTGVFDAKPEPQEQQ